VRAFLALWEPLGEPGEAAVFFEVATAAPPLAAEPGLESGDGGSVAPGTTAVETDAAAAAEAATVSETRVSPLFYAFLKAALVQMLDQSGHSQNQSSVVRVAGVALAASGGTSDGSSSDGGDSRGDGSTSGDGSSSSGDGSSNSDGRSSSFEGSSSDGRSNSDDRAAASYYLHEAGLGAGACAQLAAWGEGWCGDGATEAFAGPLVLFSDTWVRALSRLT
jgi:hypothetical protein